MLSQQENDRLTRVGADRPAGQLLRRYWMPAALSEELEGERPAVPVTLMGERLVLFRDDQGRLGLVQRHCPHRGADLCFGRLEHGGIRCVFHGWLFDVTGRCLEQPAEPAGSRMHEQVRVDSYPVVERNGIVFAYLGPGEPPPMPAFDCLSAPVSHVFAFKGLWECNWLQALEVGIDPAHASYLHRFLEDEDPADSYGRQFRDRPVNTDVPLTALLRRHDRPEIRVERTDHGLRLVTLRDPGDGRHMHVRVTHQIFPCAISIPMSTDMNITQWHVPVDDYHCYWYAMFTSYGAPVDRKTMHRQRLAEHELPDYRPKKNAANSYHYDPREQRDRTYTGMGADINVHDQWACESMGPIQDRTAEHLGRSDIAIIQYRRLLQEMIGRLEAGEGDLLLHGPEAKDLTGPPAVDCLVARDAWAEAWPEAERARRTAGWAVGDL